jgi:hypothetical protein
MEEEIEVEWSEGEEGITGHLDRCGPSLSLLGVPVSGTRGSRYAVLLFHVTFDLEVQTGEVRNLLLYGDLLNGESVCLTSESEWEAFTEATHAEAVSYANAWSQYQIKEHETLCQLLKRELGA